MERARPAEPADLVLATQLLATALEGARTMRGGAALLGARTPDDLITRWTSRGSEAALYVGEFHHAVVGLAAAATFTRTGATDEERADRMLFRGIRRPGRRRGERSDGSGGRLVRGSAAAATLTPWRCPETGHRSNASKQPASWPGC